MRCVDAVQAVILEGTVVLVSLVLCIFPVHRYYLRPSMACTSQDPTEQLLYTHAKLAVHQTTKMPHAKYCNVRSLLLKYYALVWRELQKHVFEQVCYTHAPEMQH